LADATLHKATVILNAVERILHPKRIRDITSERVSYFQSRLRDEHRADTTVAGYMRHLKAALRWAADIGMLGIVPKMPKVRRAMSIMKGRPISDTEFGRMLLCIPGVVGAEVAGSWRHYLLGLWWSGLRVTESLQLYWDDTSKLCVVIEGSDLMLRIPGELEKGKKDRLLPIAPEFADFLTEVPITGRKGRVFRPLSRRGGGTLVAADRVVRVLGEIGEAADVLVDPKKEKWASAHDLRRSFGERWSSRVMPPILMELMRHESIETTLKYYVGQNAMRTTRVLREAFERANGRPVPNDT
jgi:integrase